MLITRLSSRLIYACAASLLFLAPCAWGQRRVFTVAGGAVRDGGQATDAALNYPAYGAYDKQGNLYITDYFAHRIRRVNKSGIIVTVAGNGISGFSGEGGQAKAAMISFPVGLLIDPAGNIIFSDSGNNRVRKIDTTGVITTIAGNGTAGYAGDGGPATAAEINRPWGVALGANKLYIADGNNNVVRTVDTSGIIHTVAGNGKAGFSGDNGPATAAMLNFPEAAFIIGGNLYIADYVNRRVRKVDSHGTITTFAGTGSGACNGDGGLATSAAIGGPSGFMASGSSLLIEAGCGRTRSVDLKTNIIETISGSEPGFNGDGNSALSTNFDHPHGVGLDPSRQTMFIFDSGNNRVRGIDLATQVVSTLAGGYIGDGGLARNSNLNQPYGINFDPSGDLFIAEFYGSRVREVDATGKIKTVVGTGFTGYSGDGGPATDAMLDVPMAVAADGNGNLYVSDQGGLALRKVDANGNINTLANPLTFDYFMTSLATDSQGNLYAADDAFCVVWKITPDDVATVVAGVSGECGYNGDGIPATQALISAWGVAVDAQGTLYIADTSNNRVRKVGANGKIVTIAGNGNCGFSGDGHPAKSAMLCNPQGVAVDSNGIVYIADQTNARVRAINRAGIISTYAGTGSTSGYNGNGLPASKTNFDLLFGIAVSPDGVVHVLDLDQNRVRKIQ